MVWNQVKRSLAKDEPRTKEELITAIERFWTEKMTVEQCNRYIDHVYKVAPTCVLMKGKATGDIPNKLFPEQSCGKSFQYFNSLLGTDQVQQRIQKLGL